MSYIFEANLLTIDEGLLGDGSKVQPWLKSMEPSTDYRLCPGLPCKSYPPPAKRLKTTSLGSGSNVHEDKRDHNCLGWHIPSNRKVKCDSEMFNVCTPCKKLYAYLEK